MNTKVEQQPGEPQDPHELPQPPPEDPSLTFDIADLLKRGQGATDEYSLDTKIDLEEEEIVPQGHLKGKVEIMKIEGEFNVQVRDVEIELELKCGKCLETFTQNITIPFAEHEYLVEKIKGDKREEISLIDRKNRTLNISEFLRQEIILHSPLIPVCS